MSGKHLKKLLEQHGWQLLRIQGSHHRFRKKGVIYPIDIPIHGNEDLAIGTERKILKQAGLLHFWKDSKGGK